MPNLYYDPKEKRWLATGREDDPQRVAQLLAGRDSVVSYGQLSDLPEKGRVIPVTPEDIKRLPQTSGIVTPRPEGQEKTDIYSAGPQYGGSRQPFRLYQPLAQTPAVSIQPQQVPLPVPRQENGNPWMSVPDEPLPTTPGFDPNEFQEAQRSFMTSIGRAIQQGVDPTKMSPADYYQWFENLTATPQGAISKDAYLLNKYREPLRSLAKKVSPQVAAAEQYEKQRLEMTKKMAEELAKASVDERRRLEDKIDKLEDKADDLEADAAGELIPQRRKAMLERAKQLRQKAGGIRQRLSLGESDLQEPENPEQPIRTPPEAAPLMQALMERAKDIGRPEGKPLPKPWTPILLRDAWLTISNLLQDPNVSNAQKQELQIRLYELEKLAGLHQTPPSSEASQPAQGVLSAPQATMPPLRRTTSYL